MVDISSLSLEILRNIFLHSVDLPHYDFRDIPTPGVYRSKDTFSTPLVLSHVCSSWRQVACSYPMLWSFILLHRPLEKHMPLFDLWLSHSGNAPLSIHLQSIDEEPSTLHSQLLDLLLQHSCRLKRFIIEIHGLDEVSRFSSALCTRLFREALKFPVLERLVMKFPRLPEERLHLSKRICSAFYSIPSLKSVLMPSPCLWYHGNLTAIICETPLTYNLILCTLERCPNLVSVDVCLTSGISQPSVRHQAVEHHHLSNLRVLEATDRPQDNTGKARRLLLKYLTATKLAVLDINSDGHDIRTIHNMILRSNCQLKSLSKLSLLRACKHASRLLRLPQLHYLQQLGLRGPSRDILELLTVGSKETTTPVLPFLRLLDVEDVMPPVGTTLSDLLLSRFDSLAAATVTASDCIWNTPLAKRLWSHPGYLILAKGRDKMVDVLDGRRDGSDFSLNGEYVHHGWRPRVRSSR